MLRLFVRRRLIEFTGCFFVGGSGSYGQVGYSDMRTGATVVFHQDWAVNWELDKGHETRERALAIIDALRERELLETWR